MVINAPDIRRITMRVLRLMDADILPLDEGNALLAEIRALEGALREAAAEQATRNDHPLHPTGEALVQTDRLDASPREETSESAHPVLHDAAEQAC